MKAVLLGFLVVTAAAAMVIAAIWATTVTFGLLQSTILTVRGAGSWVAVTQESVGTMAIRTTGFLCVV